MGRKILIIIIFIMILGFLYYWFSIRPKLGEKPSGQHLNKIKASPQYNEKLKKFVNENHAAIIAANKKLHTWKIMWEFLFPSAQLSPKKKLPEVVPNLKAFGNNEKEIAFIWLGHSTFLVNMSGVIILFDPVFSGSAAPVSFFAKRFQKPVLELKNLPKVDYIIISHDHYDHLDMESIKHFSSNKTKFLVPLGVSSYLVGWGIEKNKIQELDWWQSVKIDKLEFICTPAQHFSGREGPLENPTLWASWIVKNKSQKIYFSGDSGYGTHYKQIGDKYGPFDVTFIENGQYDQRWSLIHNMPNQVGQAYFDLKSKALVPMHWGMFPLALHDWFDPIEKIFKISNERKINLLTPKLGEFISLSSKKSQESWWKKLIK